MTTENTSKDEEITLTAGQILRQAREKLGLTQQQVAESLCLRQTIIRYIEDDAMPKELSPIFARGYVRAYAKLVDIPERDVLPVMDGDELISPAPTKSTMSFQGTELRGFPLNKNSIRKRRDSILMLFTWVILIVVLGLTAVWWWQNHNKALEDIQLMDTTSTMKLNQAKDEGRVVPIAGNTEDSTSLDNVMVLPQALEPATEPDTTATASTPTETAHASAAVSSTVVKSTLSQQQQAIFPLVDVALNAQGLAQQKIAANTLTMTFSGTSWLSVNHRVNGRNVNLFTGQKKRGEVLELTGNPPYRVVLGNPPAVKVEFGGAVIPSKRHLTLEGTH